MRKCVKGKNEEIDGSETRLVKSKAINGGGRRGERWKTAGDGERRALIERADGETALKEFESPGRNGTRLIFAKENRHKRAAG